MPMKHAEPKPIKCPNDFGARLKVVEHQSDEVVLNSAESSNDVELRSIPKEIVSTEENNGVKVQPMGRPNQCEEKTGSGHSMHAQSDKPFVVSSRTSQNV